MATTQKAAAAAVKSIKGTRTEQAIVNAYISESQAYTRYIYYAQQAQKENLFPIQQVFEETAANELHHGKVFMKMLEGGCCELQRWCRRRQDSGYCLESSYFHQ